MLVVALVLAAALALVLAVALWMTRRSGAEFRTLADQRETALLVERDQLTEARDKLTDERDHLTQAHDNLTKERDQLTETSSKLKSDLTTTSAERDQLDTDLAQAGQNISRLEAELGKLRKVSDEQGVRMERQANEIGKLATENEQLHDRVEVAEAAAAAVVARDSGIVIGELDNVGSQPETLWDLEVARSERTWRNSVAINPAAETTPFDDTDDPLRLAVEVEAAALRENVGAFITIEWRAQPVADPARRHLVARVAQELLEAAARSPEASRLVVEGTDEIVLRLESVDDSDEVINIIPPRITSDLIDVRSETGINITVKAE